MKWISLDPLRSKISRQNSICKKFITGNICEGKGNGSVKVGGAAQTTMQDYPLWRGKGRKKYWGKEFNTLVNLRMFRKASGMFSDQTALSEECCVPQKYACFSSPSVFSHFSVEPVESMTLCISECDIQGYQSLWAPMQSEIWKAHTHNHHRKKLMNGDNSTEATEIKSGRISDSLVSNSSNSTVHPK